MKQRPRRYITEAEMDDQHELSQRIRKQIELEVSSDVDGLYDLIDPEIRTKRESERADEPSLTMSVIRDFVKRIKSVELTDVRVLKWQARHDGTPAAVVEIKVLYNSSSDPSKFRAVWVRRDGNWYTTALSKRFFSKHTI